MAVLINFKICDNAKECGGIAVCPTGALSWSEEKEEIVIDNDKCISCGLCEKECPIGAIRVAKTKGEFDHIQKEIEEDTRTTKDLFVDRYGATPLSEFFMINYNEIDAKLKNSNVALIECYNDDSIQCLLKSITIKELTEQLPEDTMYYKAYTTEEEMVAGGIGELPALLVYKNNKLLGAIEGYYEDSKKEEVLKKIKEILN